MPTFFHVDRTGSLEAGKTLVLINYGRSDEWQQYFLETLFDANLSRHGELYLLWQPPVFECATKLECNASGAVELFFEYFRRAHFPQRTSRLQALFAFEDYNAAVTFREGNYSTCPVFEVTSETSFRADMRLLRFGNHGLEAMDNARRYWSGEASEQPIWEHLLKLPVQVVRRIE